MSTELMRLSYIHDGLDFQVGTALGITLTAAQAEVLP